MRKIIQLISVLLFCGIASGCSKHFVVEGEFPSPLVPQIPIAAHIEYSDEFKDYVFLETSTKRPLESIGFGAAQTKMFKQVFNTMFASTEAQAKQAATGQVADITIQPTLLSLQYAGPVDTGLKMYEVSLRYRLQINDAQNKKMADWVINGFGKTPSSLLGSNLAGFNSASLLALRDVGAQLSIGFKSQPAIKDYLAARRLQHGSNTSMATKKDASSQASSGGGDQ